MGGKPAHCYFELKGAKVLPLQKNPQKLSGLGGEQEDKRNTEKKNGSISEGNTRKKKYEEKFFTSISQEEKSGGGRDRRDENEAGGGRVIAREAKKKDKSEKGTHHLSRLPILRGEVTGRSLIQRGADDIKE